MTALKAHLIQEISKYILTSLKPEFPKLDMLILSLTKNKRLRVENIIKMSNSDLKNFCIIANNCYRSD